VPDEWRLIDDTEEPRSAAEQMAVDLALLDDVAAGATPALRLYTWRGPALSLGRFQSDTDVDTVACERLGVEVVRRPTGGRALLHGGDLTYAVVFPRPPGAGGAVEALYRRLAAALISGLGSLGVTTRVGRGDGDVGPACFSSARGADLRAGDRKLCGSAQLQRDGVVLQHGSVLCRRLTVDEADLLAFPDPQARHTTRLGLRERTVTLAELGAPDDPHRVGAALTWGFARTLDLKWRSRVEGPGSPSAGR
jgi:lipoate-protein ligase A